MLKIADTTFTSRLFTGTGKFATPALMLEALRASGSQLVTLAMKRVDLRGGNDAILAPLQQLGVHLLPNTSGAKTAAAAYLEPLAQRAQQLTRQRFGHVVSFYVPLYLSNLCANDCTYCGFSMSNRMKRKTLDAAEIERECLAIKALGFEHLLLVTGEHQAKVGMNYFRQYIPAIRAHFSSLMMEVQPLTQQEYAELKTLGLDGVLVYQETYHPTTYLQHHLHGQKQDFH